MVPATSEACFTAWAPDDSLWSPWAKPIAFMAPRDAWVAPDHVESSKPAVPVAVTINPASVLIVDLPGPEAVNLGIALALHGYRPVPLFNGTSGPAAVIDVVPITRALYAGADDIERRQLPADAPPAFLLDSRRHEPDAMPVPNAYDNRWVVLPQDFPSGALLASRGLRFATVIRRGGVALRPDLAHVLRRWQEHGIHTRVIDLGTGAVTDYADVPKPSLFRLAWYAAVALLGLRRSNVGGFGSRIPERGGGGYG